MVILGGAGRQAGVVLGAIVVGVLLETLRDANDAQYVVYALVPLGLLGQRRLAGPARPPGWGWRAPCAGRGGWGPCSWAWPCSATRSTSSRARSTPPGWTGR